MYLDLKFAVSGYPNLECIRQYQYQSSLSISLYLNINTRMNPSPTGIGYLWVSVQSQSQCESESQSLSESQSQVDRVIFSLSPVSVSVWSQSQSQSQYMCGLNTWWVSVSVSVHAWISIPEWILIPPGLGMCESHWKTHENFVKIMSKIGKISQFKLCSHGSQPEIGCLGRSQPWVYKKISVSVQSQYVYTWISIPE